jgi:hypothetical protein
MNENSKLEDDLHNFWTFVKLESRKVSLLTRKVEKIAKTLSEILCEIRQRPSSHEDEDN